MSQAAGQTIAFYSAKIHLFSSSRNSILPETITKTSTERVMVLNTVACRVIDSRRGNHKEFVFTYRGKPLGKLNNSGWKRAWRKADLPTEKGISSSQLWPTSA